MSSAHSADRAAAARAIGERRREKGMSDAMRSHQRESWHAKLELLRIVRDRGEASSDDLRDDLSETAPPNSTNWVGAAIGALGREGVIVRVGERKSVRAARFGSRIGVWRAACPVRLAAKIREIEGLLATSIAPQDSREDTRAAASSAAALPAAMMPATAPTRSCQPTLPIAGGQSWMGSLTPSLWGG
jgi:hypothetical protein